MTSKKKGSRVTPKGTQNPSKSKKPRRTDLPTLPDQSHGHLPNKVRGEHGRGSRPISHNRGNR